MKKLKGNDLHAPVQFVSPYPPHQCRSLIETSVTDINRLLFTKIDDSLIQFRINFGDDFSEYVAIGSLRSLIGGEQTHITCRIQREEEVTALLTDIFSSKKTRSIEQAKAKAESQLFDRLVALLSEPESA